LTAHNLILPALTVDECERHWTESRLFGALFGIAPTDLPADWASFVAYNEAMAQSDILSVSTAARDVAEQIFSGGRTWLRPPRWYRALSVQMLPERLRVGFEFPIDEHDRRAAERALEWIRRVYPTLPTRLRTVGPIRRRKRDCKKSRNSIGLRDGLIGFGSDDHAWMANDRLSKCGLSSKGKNRPPGWPTPAGFSMNVARGCADGVA
jgi:uncharacterized protein (DUF2236 family)